MGAPTIYRWDDTDAPVASGERGSMVNILKKCLVEGYGSKAAAGWTMPFVNAEASKAAFRNDSVAGTGMFFQVDNTYSNTNYAKVQAYETMIDVESGTGPFSNPVLMHNVSSSSAATPRPWIIIADNRIFYFFSYQTASLPFVGNPTSLQMQITVFGDIVSLAGQDPYACVLIGGTSGSYAGYFASTASAATATKTGFFVARNFAGDVGIKQFTLNPGGGPSSATMGQLGLPYGDGHPHVITRPTVNDGVAYSMRGWMPGLYYPCHELPYTMFDEIALDGKTFVAFQVASYSTKAQILIDVGETFRP